MWNKKSQRVVMIVLAVVLILSMVVVPILGYLI